MYCPKCGSQSKVNRFCARCGFNLMLLQYRGAPVVATSEAVIAPVVATERVIVAPSFVTQQFAAAQTVALASRVTTPEREASQAKLTAKIKTTKPYVSVMLAASVLVFVTAMSLWRSQNVPAQTVAHAAEEITTAQPRNSFAVAVTEPTPQSDSAWTVIEDQTQAVSDAANALAADQQMAVIEPGGQLALAMTADQFFANSAGADVQIRGASAQPTAYRIFVRNEANAAWQRIDVNRRGFAQGTAQHDMGHHGIARARQMMIRNDSVSVLEIDSVAMAYPNLMTTVHSNRH